MMSFRIKNIFPWIKIEAKYIYSDSIMNWKIYNVNIQTKHKLLWERNNYKICKIIIFDWKWFFWQFFFEIVESVWGVNMQQCVNGLWLLKNVRGVFA